MTKLIIPVPFLLLTAALIAGLAFWVPHFGYYLDISTHTPLPAVLLSRFIPPSLVPVAPEIESVVPSLEDPPFECRQQNYTTQIISLDPLVIYIQDFLNNADISGLLKAGETRFNPSNVQRSGYNQVATTRTSSSAGLPRDDAAVQCVLARAQRFMGTMINPDRTDMGIAQLVRYTEGQRFDVHHDWFDMPQITLSDPKRRQWNRVASFFAILEANGVQEGETWFPYIKTVETQPSLLPPKSVRKAETDGGETTDVEDSDFIRPFWREHPEGGLAFRPVEGNAVFWVNLHPNGTGDMRTMHAGLPVKGGRKTAMNIWPKKYFD